MSSLTVALAQLAPRLGALDENLERHHELIGEARHEGADLVVFPELGLTGYLLQDLNAEVAMRRDDPRLMALAQAADGLVAIVSFVEESEDHRLFIAAALLEAGAVRHVHRKVFLPTYGLFDERRFFAPGSRLRAVTSERLGLRLGLSVCEDFWHMATPQLLALDGAQVLVNVSSSPGRDVAAVNEAGLGTATSWRTLNRTYAQLTTSYVIFVNRVGVDESITFWGGSEVVSPTGQTVFCGALSTTRACTSPRSTRSPSVGNASPRPSCVTSARRSSCDSSTTSCATARSAPRPSQRCPDGCGSAPARCPSSCRPSWPSIPRPRCASSASSSVPSCARQASARPCSVCRAASTRRWWPTWSRMPSVPPTCWPCSCPTGPRPRSREPTRRRSCAGWAARASWSTSAPWWTPTSRPLGARDATPLRRGNLMARTRMMILYDHSVTWNGLVVGTGNKTETLIGYSTLWGDSASAFNPIGDLYKSQIRQLSRAIGVPEAIIRKAPSADLWPGQTDEAEVGFSYADVDRILFRLVDRRLTPDEVVAEGFARELVERIDRMVAGSEFKRQVPPIAKIGPRTAGIDYLYPRRRPRSTRG